MLIAVGVITALRIGVFANSGLELHGDEAQYWTWSRDLTWGYFSKPPMIAWVIRAATEMCGESAACIRLPSPLLHFATAVTLAALAHRLYDTRTALWTMVAYATLPAVTFSSGIMSTDIPLLFFWSVSLYALVRLLDDGEWRWAFLLGAAIGLGAMSKYAMLYFAACAVIFCVVRPEARWLLRSPKALLVLVLAGLIVAPNIHWNMSAGWVTVGHTADNANWSGLVLHWDKMFDFFAAQFGVFGPVFFAALLARPFLGRGEWSEADRYLIIFSLPIVALIVVQALLSRAHANWAATAYCAATPLVVSMLLAGRRRWWLFGSVGLHVVVAALLYVAVLAPRDLSAKLGRDPFAKLTGWTELAKQVKREYKREAAAVLLFEDRMTFAAMAHVLRDDKIPFRMWDYKPGANNHYELTKLFDTKAAELGPVMLLTDRKVRPGITKQFESMRIVGAVRRPDHLGGGKTYYLLRFEGFSGKTYDD